MGGGGRRRESRGQRTGSQEPGAKNQEKEPGVRGCWTLAPGFRLLTPESFRDRQFVDHLLYTQSVFR